MRKSELTHLVRTILSEIELLQYRALIRVKYNPDYTMTEIADMIRALPEVTIVTNVSHDEQAGIAVYSVKILTTKTGTEAYETLKQNAITKVPDIQKLEVGAKTIERIE